jgi:hypothetical protein
MNILDSDDEKLLAALRKAVAEDLERKRRLGHYAVIWRDGKPAFIGEPCSLPKEAQTTELYTKRD